MEYHKIKKMTDTQIAYFAGLLDGEGCVRIGIFKNLNKEIRYRAYMVIAMTDLKPINWLIKIVGGKKYTDKKFKKGNSKICHCWNMNSQEGSEILQRALPYLLVKKKQAINFIKFSKTLTGQGGKGINKPIPISLLKKREKMFLINKSLNKKGII